MEIWETPKSLDFFGIEDWEFLFQIFLGLRKTLSVVRTQKIWKKKPLKNPKSRDFPPSIQGWISLPESPNFPVWFFNFYFYFWDRTIPGILESWDFNPRGELGEFSQFLGFFGKNIPNFPFLWKPLGAQQFLGIFPWNFPTVGKAENSQFFQNILEFQAELGSALKFWAEIPKFWAGKASG